MEVLMLNSDGWMLVSRKILEWSKFFYNIEKEFFWNIDWTYWVELLMTFEMRFENVKIIK